MSSTLCLNFWEDGFHPVGRDELAKPVIVVFLPECNPSAWWYIISIRFASLLGAQVLLPPVLLLMLLILWHHWSSMWMSWWQRFMFSISVLCCSFSPQDYILWCLHSLDLRSIVLYYWRWNNVLVLLKNKFTGLVSDWDSPYKYWS
jgi:hypothetical protein